MKQAGERGENSTKPLRNRQMKALGKAEAEILKYSFSPTRSCSSGAGATALRWGCSPCELSSLVQSITRGTLIILIIYVIVPKPCRNCFMAGLTPELYFRVSILP